MTALPAPSLLPTTKGASLTLGIGMGGFVDGILLHQILEWHNMGWGVLPPTTMEGMRQNMLWDGAFHAAVWVITLLGIYWLVRDARRGASLPSGRAFTGQLLFGWGFSSWWRGSSTTISSTSITRATSPFTCRCTTGFSSRSAASRACCSAGRCRRNASAQPCHRSAASAARGEMSRGTQFCAHPTARPHPRRVATARRPPRQLPPSARRRESPSGYEEAGQDAGEQGASDVPDGVAPATPLLPDAARGCQRRLDASAK